MTPSSTPEPGALDGECGMIKQLARLQREQAGWASRLGQPGCAARLNAADNAEALAWAVKALSRPHVPAHSADAGDVVSGGEGEGGLKPGWLKRSLDRAKVEAEAIRLAKKDPQGVIDAVAALRPSAGAGAALRAGIKLRDSTEGIIRDAVAGAAPSPVRPDPETEGLRERDGVTK